MADNRYQEARTAVHKLIAQKKELAFEKFNEAETRKFFIDVILQDVLGWHLVAPTVCLERSPEKDLYYDYLLKGIDGSCKLIVEAKREGISFELPEKKGDIIDIDQFRTTKGEKNPLFYKAIVQAIKYARSANAPYVAICNGHQLVLALSQFESGFDEKYGKAIVFRSLEDIEKRLGELIDYASRDSLLNNLTKLSRKLHLDEPFLAAYTLSNRIVNYPREYKRKNIPNDLMSAETEIKNICGAIVHGIDKNAAKFSKTDEYIENCYITSVERAELEKEQKKSDRLRAQKPFTEEFKQHAKIDELLPAQKMNGVNESLLNPSTDPVVIMGNIGVGKSIFIDYLIHTNSFLNKKCYITKVNFLDLESSDPSEIKVAIAQSIIKSMADGGRDPREPGVIKDTYATDISNIVKYFGNVSDEVIQIEIGRFLQKKILEPVALAKDTVKKLATKSDSKNIIVFLDNVDQKTYREQLDIYTIARELMSSWGVYLCFITMVPSTYLVAQPEIRGPKSTGHSKAFTVTAPPVSMILQKRIQFLNKLVKEERLREFGYIFDVVNPNITKFFDTLLNVLVISNRIGEMIAHLAGDNVRKATDIIQNYIESPISKLVEWSDKNKKYEAISEIPSNQFRVSIMKMGRADFDPKLNPWIANLFRVTEQNPREHLLAPGILNKMMNIADTANSYCSVDELIHWGQAWNFMDREIASHILYLAEKNLIEAVDLDVHTIEKMAISYRIKTSGKYHLLHLMQSSAYVEEMVKVTPIFDKKITLDINTFDPIKSINNAKQFCGYLSNIYISGGFDDTFLPRDLISQMEASVSEKDRHFQQEIAQK